MRIRTTLAALAAFTAALAAVPATATPPATNWVLYRVDMQAPAAEGFVFSFHVAESVPITEHTMHFDAVSWGAGQWYAHSTEDEHLYGGHVYGAVDLTSPLDASEHLRLADDPEPRDYSVHGAVGVGAGGFAYLLFASLSGTFAGQPSFAVNHAATARRVASGDDAGYLMARGTGTGLGLGVSGFGPALTTVEATFDRGAVFTVPVFDCYEGDCTWDGVAPDRATLHYVMHANRGGGSAEGPGTIAGPAGTWRWSLDALGYDGFAMVGYVPIGRYADA